MKIEVGLKDVLTPLEAVGLIRSNAKMIDEARRSSSLIEFTRPTRVEPTVLVDQRTMGLPYITDVMHSLNSIFTGYYLQAMALSVDINGVNTIRQLDKLNPRRDPAGAWIGGPATESNVSIESGAYELPRSLDAVSMEKRGVDNRKAVEQANNLAVGKLIEVKVGHDTNSAVIPVTVRLLVAAMAPDTLVHSLAVGGGERSVKERWHAWRAGQLSFVKDLILCQDLIAKHRKDLIDDPSGYYQQATSRNRKNQAAALASQNPSIATASSMFVMTEKTCTELEAQLGGKISDFKVREKLFKATYGMIMVVIDPEWEQVTFYHQSLDTPTELSVRDIKSANRGDGPDVFEILKAFQLGQSPSI